MKLSSIYAGTSQFLSLPCFFVRHGYGLVQDQAGYEPGHDRSFRAPTERLCRAPELPPLFADPVYTSAENAMICDIQRARIILL